jgi:hypothetical protein
VSRVQFSLCPFDVSLADRRVCEPIRYWIERPERSKKSGSLPELEVGPESDGPVHGRVLGRTGSQGHHERDGSGRTERARVGDFVPEREGIARYCLLRQTAGNRVWVYGQITGERNVMPRLQSVVELRGREVGMLRADDVDPNAREE